MRHILQGFTMYIDGSNFSYDTESVTLPTPTPDTQEYQGGGMDLKVAQPMASIQALECTVKMSGLNPDIQKRLARGPGQAVILTFRGAVLDEPTGSYIPHVAVVQGCPNFGSRDEWKRGEKAGIEFMVNGITYFRYESGADVIHELQAWPPKRVVNGIEQLAGINAALGY